MPWVSISSSLRPCTLLLGEIVVQCILLVELHVPLRFCKIDLADAVLIILTADGARSTVEPGCAGHANTSGDSISVSVYEPDLVPGLETQPRNHTMSMILSF